MRISGLTMSRQWQRPRLRLGVAVTVIIGTALLSGVIHIVAILAVPYFAEADGWSRLVPHAGEDMFAELPAGESAQGAVPGLDPLFVNGACRLDLASTPAGITVDARDRFWSAALYDPQGTIIFSLNDRTAAQGRLDMIVVNTEQNAQLRANPTIELELTIVAESRSDDLIVLLRLFAPTAATRADARRILQQSECLPAPSVIQPPETG